MHDREVPARVDRRRFDPANPVFAFAFVWLATLMLTGMRLLPLIEPLHEETVLLIGANIVSFALIYVVMARRGRRAAFVPAPVLLKRMRVAATVLLLVWATGTTVETIVAGGLPFIWKLEHVTTVGYGDFGIPSVHGLLNALYLFSLSILYYDYRLTRRRRALVGVLLLLLWPVLVLSRGLLVWAVFQLVGLHLLLAPLGWRRVWQPAAFAFLFMIVFGVLGNFRIQDTPQYAFEEELTGPAVDPGHGPVVGVIRSGFGWVYTYVTASLNNVNAALPGLKPKGTLYYSLEDSLPSFVRTRFYDPESLARFPLPLVTPSYTTSTLYAPYLADFGVGGAVIAVALIQVVIVFVYLRARRGVPWMVLGYAVLFQGMMLSVTTNTLTHAANLAQLALAWLLGWLVTRSGAPAKSRG